jgi:hypothetical protein
MLKSKHDWTYSQGCGCEITIAEDGHYLRVTPGKSCTLHTASHQDAARKALVAQARAALAEYRRIIETAGGRFLMSKQHDGQDLFAVVDGDCMSGFMPLSQALRVAHALFGSVMLHVWDCDLMTWRFDISDLLC